MQTYKCVISQVELVSEIKSKMLSINIQHTIKVLSNVSQRYHPICCCKFKCITNPWLQSFISFYFVQLTFSVVTRLSAIGGTNIILLCSSPFPGPSWPLTWLECGQLQLLWLHLFFSSLPLLMQQ